MVKLNEEAKKRRKTAKKRKKTAKNSAPPSPPPSSKTSFSSIPNDVAMNCFARISRSYYPILSIVCKSFLSILSSKDLYSVRSHLGNTEQCVYVCLSDPNDQYPQWLTLRSNPNRNLPDSTIKKGKKKTIGPVLVPITSSDIPSLSKPIVIGSEVYVIGGPVHNEPSSTVRILDCGTHTWRKAPSMNVARENAATCVYDGKIYVMGGCKGLEDESWAEVFDIKAQTWKRLPHPGTEVPKCPIYRISEIDGKINFGNSNKMYAYDTKHSKWDCGNIPATLTRSEECILEDVSYAYGNDICFGYNCFLGSMWCWYDIKDGEWKIVKGLDLLDEIYSRNGGSDHNTTKLVTCGGKLLLIWEGYMKHNPKNRKKIWCAEIVTEKREGGELWGNAEWVDVVYTVPVSWQLLHCLVVSV